MGQSLADLAINLTANIAGFTSDLGRASREAKKRSEDMARQFRQLGGAIAGALSARAFVGFIKGSIDAADMMRDLSKQFGVSVSNLSQYQSAIQKSGSSLEALARGFKFFSKEASEGSKALEAMGIEARNADGSVKDLNALFDEVAEKFKGYKDGAEKAALAQRLFGKAGQELIPLLNEGAAGLEAMREKSDALGATISTNLANQADQFNDNLTDLGALTRGFANDVAEQLLPSLNSFTEYLVNAGIEARKTSEGSTLLADSIKALVIAGVVAKNAFESLFDLLIFGGRTVITVNDAFVDLGDNIGHAVAANFKILQGDFAGALETIKEAASEVGAVTADTFNKMGAELDALRSGFSNSQDDIENALNALNAPANAAADSIERLGKNSKEAANNGKALPPVIRDAAEEAKKFVDEFDEVVKVYEKAKRENEELIKSLEGQLDPIQAINDEYEKNVAAIQQQIQWSQSNSEKVAELTALINKLSAARDKDIAAMKQQLDPLGKLTRDLEFEVAVSKLGNIERQREILLRNLAVKATAEQIAVIDTLIAKQELANSKGLFGSVIDSQGFGQSLDTFEDLLGTSIEHAFKYGLDGGLSTLRRGLAEAFKDFDSGTKSVESIANFLGNAINQFRNNPDAPLRALNNIASTLPGTIGDVARAVSAIDSLFGGRLLGTNFERQSSSASFSISNSGATGSTSITESRQRSFFRGRQTRTTAGQLDAGAQSQLQQFFDGLRAAVGQAARALGTDAGELLAGSFKQEFDKNGNLVRQFSTVLGRTFNETIEDFQKRITGENLLQVLQRSIGEGSEINQIAERWRASASRLLDGAQFLLAAQAAINDGQGLLELGSTLTDVADLVTRLNQAGESMSQTFERLQQSTQLFEEALGLMGQSLSMTRVEFVEFAADIADSAGGLQRAAQLWNSYFENFYSAEERVSLAVRQARQTASELLNGVGLKGNIDPENFRRAFEEALPRLSSEQIANWLRAGEALANLTNSEAALTEARQQAADATRELDALMRELSTTTMSEFATDVYDISERVQEFAARANELARQAGRAGASQEELGHITQWAAHQVEMAVDRLRDRVQGLADQLYGSELDQVQQQIDAITQANQDAQSAIEDTGRAQQQRYEQEMQYIESIRDFVRSLRLSDLSPLNPQQRFNEARSQFADTLSRARGGDVEALGALQGLAQQLLQEGRSFLGPSDQFQSLFDEVSQALNGLSPSQQPGEGPPIVTIVPSDQLNELFARREQILMEQEERNRESLAGALAAQLGELSIATRESAVDIAEQMGISLAELVTDLGISLNDLSVDTTRELADVARTLNLSVTDLANSVGVSLGELTETNSLLNDAFEAEIASLPQDIQEQLYPLLRAVENAVNDADANSALAALRAAVGNLAPDVGNQVAGYLNIGYAVQQPLQDLYMITESLGEEQIELLDEVTDILERIAENTAPPDPGRVIPPPGGGTPPTGGAGGGGSPGDSTAGGPGSVQALLSQLIYEVKSGAARQSQAIELAAQKMAKARGY